MAQKRVIISKRRQRLEAILERLKSGAEVSLRDFKNAISEGDYAGYLMRIEHQKLMAGGYSDSCAAYDELLKLGIFHYNRSKRKTLKDHVRQRFKLKSQECFERGLRVLREQARQNPMLEEAYDRDFHDICDTTDPIGMPRRVTSKSWNNQNAIDQKLDKRAIKIEVVEDALKTARENEERGVEEKRPKKAGVNNLQQKSVQKGRAKGKKSSQAVSSLKGKTLAEMHRILREREIDS